MNKFIEKNEVLLFCIGVFLLLTLIYKGCSMSNEESRAKKLEYKRIEDSTENARNLLFQQEIEAKEKEQKKIEYQNKKREELQNAYNEIRYYFNDFTVDSLEFAHNGNFEYYLYDIVLTYEAESQELYFKCKDSKGKCMKQTKRYNSYDESTYVVTTDSFSYSNITQTEFEKSKSAFDKYKRLLKEVREMDESTN